MGSREEKAAELYAGGSSINAVATALGITWWEAKKLKTPDTGDGGGKAAKRKAHTAKKLRPDKPDEPDETDEPDGDDLDADGNPKAWDVMLQLPTARLDGILANFTAQEKANAIAAVLQARLDVEPEPEPDAEPAIGG